MQGHQGVHVAAQQHASMVVQQFECQHLDFFTRVQLVMQMSQTTYVWVQQTGLTRQKRMPYRLTSSATMRLALLRAALCCWLERDFVSSVLRSLRSSSNSAAVDASGSAPMALITSRRSWARASRLRSAEEAALSGCLPRTTEPADLFGVTVT